MSQRTNVEVPRRSYFFPALCPKCLNPGATRQVELKTEQEKYKGLNRREYLLVKVPFCDACATRQVWRNRLAIAIPVLILVAILAIGSNYNLSRMAGFLIFLVLAAPFFLFFRYYKNPVRITAYNDKTITFSFENQEYAQAFIAANPKS